jgi:hypothetical protein
MKYYLKVWVYKTSIAKNLSLKKLSKWLENISKKIEIYVYMHRISELLKCNYDILCWEQSLLKIMVSCRIHAPPGYPPLWPSQAPTSHWIHTPLGSPHLRPWQTPVWSSIQALLGSPPFRLSSESMPLRPCQVSAPCGMTGATPHCDPHPLDRAGTQLYRLARERLHQAPAQATTRGLQTRLRDTHRQDCMLREEHKNN